MTSDGTFSETLTGHWIPEGLSSEPEEGGLLVVVDDSLPPPRALMAIERPRGGGVVRLTPHHATVLGLEEGSRVEVADVRSAAAAAGIALHDPDHLFYLPVEEQEILRIEGAPEGTRGLTDSDAAAFAEFTSAAPPDELAEAFIELDHWLVFGTVVDGRIVAAASLYPWNGTHLADLGVLTLPAYRGSGLARRTVRAASAAALAVGYEPQYRCQLENTASVALAASAGFERFGTWHVITPDA